ncbi:SLATT domain-containing protein [Microbacterium wangruii]|uniref:SLATT domain-containing protein n=1 Tax=Microbacterium wangruii TaxID=3049073 RepID=UPI00256EAC8A|nr:SLATT domain-containing protein [Microbacterium sp. zg-Y1211]MDL5485945.1 SLATT domain-containing protein [Microbacterium sp. zg-Y1211]
MLEAQISPESRPLTPGMAPLEAAEGLLRSLAEARSYAQARRRTWSRWSTGIRLLMFTVSALATITLGLATTDAWGKVGFVLSALVTSLTALEPFFNWRSRWVDADEALAGWYDVEEDLRRLVETSPEAALTHSEVERLYKRYRKIWNDWSASWVSARRSTD